MTSAFCPHYLVKHRESVHVACLASLNAQLRDVCFVGQARVCALLTRADLNSVS